MSQRQTEEDVVDELAEEFARRLRAGERPSVEEFAARHPDRADEIREVLLAVEVMERLKPRPEDTPAAQKPRPAERIPERIGEYRIVREIGRGGMGVVYEAEQEALGRRVALKVLPAHLVADEKARARFRRESQAAARLHHTNVVPVFGAGESGGLCFYVMQLIEGRSLDHLIRAAASYSGAPTDTSPWGKRPASAAPTDPATQEEAPAENLSLDGPILLDVRAAARIAEQAADALHYAHSQGVLHRDVKPSNLLLDARGTVWVTDFGVAKLAEEARLTLSGDLVGTLKYVPPERFSGHTDARGDTYSLGVTLYEMLTLRSAFPDTNAQHLIHLITTQTPDPPRVRNPAVPSDLETIVLKAVARDPDQRYQTAAQFAEDLRRFLDDRPILARRAGPAERAWRWCRRNPSLAVAGAAILILMAAVTVVSLAGYLRVSAANERTKETLAAEKAQREHAEETASLALAALNRTFDQFAPARLVATPPASADGVELPPASLPPDAIGLLEDLLRTYEQVARAGGEYPRLQAQAAEAYHRIGDVHQRLGRHEQAAAAYRAAIELYDHLPDDQVTDATPVKLARSRNELGRVLRTLRKLDEAERAHRLAIQTLTDLPRAAASRPECRFELARSYYLLGLRDFLDGPGGKGPPHKKGDRKGHDRPPPPPDEPADAPGRKAAELLEELVREFPKMPEYRHLLACCYRDVPPAPPRGRPDGKPKPDRAVDLLRALAADFPRVPDYRLDLCDALARHVPPGHGEQPADREKRMREAIDLASELAAQYPNVPEYAAAQARYLDLLGFDLFESSKPSDAAKLHRQAIAIQVKLVRQYPGVVAYEFWLFLMERSLGRSLNERGELKEAKTYQQSAIDRAEKLRKSDPNLKGVRPVLGMAYRELAQTLTKAGDTAGADRARRAAEEFGGDRPDGPGGPKKRGGQRR